MRKISDPDEISPLYGVKDVDLGLPKGISHFDGISPVAVQCKFCKLNVNEEYRDEDFCKPCSNFLRLLNVQRSLSRFALPSLLLAISIWLIPAFEIYNGLLPILIIFFLVPTILSSSVVTKQIYRGLKPRHQITHQLLFYSKLSINNSTFYKTAIDNIQNGNEDVGIELRDIILFQLVDYILLENKPTSSDFFDIWSTGLGLEIEEMVDLIFEKTNIMDAFDFHKGVGVLPILWPLINTKPNIRDAILDRLVLTIEDLNEATENEKKYFLEDMYLIEDEINEVVVEKQKWFAIQSALDNFVPEEPPKNPLQSMMAQANENARLMEQQKRSKELASRQNPKE